MLWVSAPVNHLSGGAVGPSFATKHERGTREENCVPDSSGEVGCISGTNRCALCVPREPATADKRRSRAERFVVGRLLLVYK